MKKHSSDRSKGRYYWNIQEIFRKHKHKGFLSGKRAKKLCPNKNYISLKINDLNIITLKILESLAPLRYNTVVMNDMASVMGVNDESYRTQKNLGRKTMAKFYESVWVPYIVTKKKILLLAIASFIALC